MPMAQKQQPDSDIPSLFFHLHDFTFSSSRKTRDWFCDVFVYEPENIDERPLGSLFLLGEVSQGEQEKTKHVLNLIASILKKEYYRLPKRGPRRSFEAALQKVNTALADFTIQGNTSWLGNIHALAGSFDGHILRITRCGDARCFLVRDRQILDISESLEQDSEVSKNEQPLKTFMNVVSGALAPDDIVLFATRRLFYHISLEQLRHFAASQSPGRIVQELSAYFRSHSADSDVYFSFIAAKVSFQEDAAQVPEPPQDSSVRLNEILKDNPAETSLAGVDSISVEDMDEAEEELQGQSKQRKRFQSLRSFGPSGLRSNDQTLEEALEEGEVEEGRLVGVVSFFRNRFFPFLSKVFSFLYEKIRSVFSWLKKRIQSPKKSESEDIEDVDSDSGDMSFRSSQKGSSLKVRSRTMFQKFLLFMRGLPRRIQRSSILAKAIISIVLLIAVVLVVTIVMRHRTQLRDEEVAFFSERVAAVEQSLQDLEVNVIYKQEEQAHGLVTTIEEQISQLRELEGSEEKVTQFEASLLDILDKLDHIVRIDSPNMIADFGVDFPDASFREVFGHSNILYSYGSDGVIYSLSIDGGDIKTFDGLQGSDIRYATVYSKADELIVFTAEGVSSVDLASGEAVELDIEGFPANDIRDLASYGNYIYYFDSENSQITRHLRVRGGFASGLAWVKPAEVIEMSNAQSMAINGSIFVLMSDGSITRYLSGYRKETLQPKLSKPVTSATRIFTDDDLEQLFIVEPEQQRLILVDMQGALQQQYTGDALHDIKDVWVDNESQRVFVLSGSKILEITE